MKKRLILMGATNIQRVVQKDRKKDTGIDHPEELGSQKRRECRLNKRNPCLNPRRKEKQTADRTGERRGKSNSKSGPPVMSRGEAVYTNVPTGGG